MYSYGTFLLLSLSFAAPRRAIFTLLSCADLCACCYCFMSAAYT